MTQRDPVFGELLDAAIAVAAAAPNNPHQHVFAAKVPWTRIQRLRAALDAAGIEWRDG